MKLSIITTILFIFIFNFKLIGQPDTCTNRLKFYINGSYQKYNSFIHYYNLPDHDTVNSDNTDIDIGYLSVAFEQKGKNGNSHEFEFTQPRLKSHSVVDIMTNNNDGTSQITSFDLYTFWAGVRYQGSYYFINKRASKLKPYLGLAPEIISCYQYISPVKNTYAVSYTLIDFSMSIIPGIEVKLFKHISVDMNMPVLCYEFVHGKTIVNEPSKMDEIRTNKSPKNKFFPRKYFMRIGIVYQI